jgi:hypothetical protein
MEEDQITTLGNLSMQILLTSKAAVRRKERRRQEAAATVSLRPNPQKHRSAGLSSNTGSQLPIHTSIHSLTVAHHTSYKCEAFIYTQRYPGADHSKR